MQRRDALRSLAGGLAAVTLTPSAWSAEPLRPATRLGVVSYCFNLRRQAQPPNSSDQDLGEPLAFLEYCQRLGAGGIQVSLPTRDAAYTARFRKQAERGGLFVEGIAELPNGERDLERFDTQLRAARTYGAEVVRVVMLPGRRYEQFNSRAEFEASAATGLKSLQLAEPIAARHGVRLAVENHKDHRIEEKLAVLRQVSSRFVGLCVDTGNNLALLEDPLETVRALAPWACSVHLKDHLVRETPDGFLLADAALGDGFLDLKQMVRALQQANPQVRFALETITRDALRIPCLTEKYWATFADVSGRDLARTLRLVRQHAAAPWPEPSSLPAADRVAFEETMVKKSLAFAREQLGL